jgi:hypothetical protein
MAGTPSGDPGDVLELPAAVAATLIERGSAVAVTRAAETASMSAGPETAIITAAVPKKRAKRKRRASHG